MDREKLEEWVQNKLDSGVEPERVKKSLEKTGHDPSVVDELVNETKEQDSGDDPDEFMDREKEELTHEDMDQHLEETSGRTEEPVYIGSEQEEPGDSVQDENGESYIDLNHRKEEVEKVAGNFEMKVGKNWKPIALAAVLLVSLSGGIMYAPELPSSSNITSAFSQKTVDTEEEKMEKASLPDRSEPEIKGEEYRVVLTDKLAKPSRASIKETDGVRLVNNASHSFNVSFDTSIESFVLPAGKSWLIAPDSITYYTAKPLEEGEEVKGSVYVE